MKKLLFSLFTLASILTGNAMESGDTTRVTTLNDIIAQESKSKTDVKYDQHLRNVWSKNTFFNISFNKTELSSKQFPTAQSENGFSNSFKCDLGVGLQWGQTFNFHKKALGNVVFIGLDYIWMDMNFNQYKQKDQPKEYVNTPYTTLMPWHNKKMTLDYGMSIGPSLTLYPFTPLRKSASDNIRLQGYFHVGYKAAAYMIKDLENKNQFAWGHGLYTAFGGNITFNAIGFGIDVRNDNNINVKHVKNDFGSKKMKFKEKTTRFYIQFRF